MLIIGAIALAWGIGRLINRPAINLGGGSGGGSSNLPQTPADFPTGANSFYGTPIPVGFGKRAVVGVPLWKGNERFASSGGNAQPIAQHFIDFAIGFGRSGVPAATLEGTAVRKIWMDGVLVLDRTTDTGIAASQDLQFTLYPGSETQTPDPLIVADKGADAPAFRGTVYIVFKNFPLHRFNLSRIPIVRAELVDVINPMSRVTEMARLTPSANDIGATTRTQCTDWTRNRLFTFNNSATAPEYNIYDVTQNRMVLTNSITKDGSALQNILYADANKVGPIVEALYGYLVLLTDEGSSYAMHLVDPMSGKVVATTIDGDVLTGATSDFPAVWGAHSARVEGGLRQGFIVLVGIIMHTNVYVYDDQSLELSLADGGSTRLSVSGGDQARGVFPGEAMDQDTLADETGELAYTGCACFYLNTECFVWRMIVSLELGVRSLERIWTKPNHVGTSNFGIAGIAVDRLNAEVTVLYAADTGTDRFIARIKAFWAGYQSELGFGWVDDEVNTTTLYEDLPVGATISSILFYYTANTTDGTLGYHISSNFYLIQLRTGEVSVYTYEDYVFSGTDVELTMGIGGNNDVWWGPAQLFFSYDQSGDFDWSRIVVNRAVSDRIQLSDLVSWWAQFAGYASGDITVDGITDIVTGSLILERVGLFDLLGQTGLLFGFDMYESEAEIKIISKGRGVGFALDWTVPSTDLGWINSQGDTVSDDDRPLRTRRGFADAPPGVMEGIFLDETLGYVVNQASVKRTTFPVQTADTDEVLSIVVPIVMTPAEMMTQLSRVLYDVATGDVVHEGRLPPKYMRLEPTDIVSTTVDGFTFVFKVTQTNVNADGSVSFTGVNFVSEAAEVSEIEGPDVTPEPIVGVSYSDLFLIDSPPLDYIRALGAGDGLLMSNAMVSQNYGWQGSTLYAAWRPSDLMAVKYSNTIDAFHGFAQDFLTDQGMPCTVDSEQTLTVVVVTGTLETITMDELLAGGNLLYYGAVGRWELIAPMTVTDNLDGTYTFSDILRGRRGTENFMLGHQSGDRVILAVGNHLVHTPLPIASFGLATRAAAVGFNNTLPETTIVSWLANGNGVKPFGPRNLAGVLDGSDIDLSWTRRTRASGDFWTWSVPDDIDSVDGVEYEIDIFDAAGTTIKRTLTGLTSGAYTYLNADIITDLGALPAQLWIEVFQVSSVAGVGRGFGTKQQITIG